MKGRAQRVWLVFSRVHQDRKQILLAKRGPNCGNPGKWGLIGGGVDDRESHSKAVVRECFEETGLAIQESQVKYRFHIVEGKKDLYYYTATQYIDIDKDLKTTEESVAYAWHDVDGLLADMDSDAIHFSATYYLEHIAACSHQ